MLLQSHFIACTYKVQTFFKLRGVTLPQWSATFPSSRAKNKLCRAWRAVLIFYQQFRSFAIYDVAKTWELMEFESDQIPDFTVHSENLTYEIQHNCSTVPFLKRSPPLVCMQYMKLQGGHSFIKYYIS